jgi:primosomal protein N' (replication factor Y)
MADTGLIVVDEEHDGSFKQQDGFRYSARDVAVKRAQLEGCPVLLGSATPSLESVANVPDAALPASSAARTPGGGELPRLRTLDLRGLSLSAGMSEPLLESVRDNRGDAGQQALLFLNRRGYAPTLQCHHCGWVAGCDHCDARLTVHLRKRCLRCHHCGARYPLPERNARTAAAGRCSPTAWARSRPRNSSAGTIDCPIHRVDSDAMRGRDAMQSLLDIADSARALRHSRAHRC